MQFTDPFTAISFYGAFYYRIVNHIKPFKGKQSQKNWNWSQCWNGLEIRNSFYSEFLFNTTKLSPKIHLLLLFSFPLWISAQHSLYSYLNVTIMFNVRLAGLSWGGQTFPRWSHTISTFTLKKMTKLMSINITNSRPHQVYSQVWVLDQFERDRIDTH